MIDYNYGTSGGVNDHVSRLSSLLDGSTHLEDYEYLGLAVVVQRAHPQPGVNLTYIASSGTGDAGDKYVGLDRFGRVTDVRWKTSSTDLDRFQYGYDRNSNRLWRDNLVNTAYGELYTYDGLNQLDSFGRGTLNGTKTGFTGSASRTQGWTPDAAGNFSTVTTNGTGQSRSHNRQNQITALGSATPSYDSDGNLTGDGTWTITYDAWNRLISLTSGATSVTYAYDALGRRITETPSFITLAGPLQLYYNAAWQVIEERWTYSFEDTLTGGEGGQGLTSGPNVNARYVWSPAGIDTLVLRDVPSGQRLYVLQDAQSNVTALVDATGAVVERSIQDPYGVRTVLTASWGSRSATLYDWKYYHQGLRLDWTQTLYDNRMRMYSPTLMRFLQNDPIGFAAGDQNLYRYVQNNSVNHQDPSGEILWGIVIGAVIGGIVGYVRGGWSGAGRGAAIGAIAGATGGLVGPAIGSAVGGAAGGGVVGGAIGGVVGGAAAGAAASGVSQMVELALGWKPGWSWSQFWGDVALGGLVGGITGAIQGGLTGGGRRPAPERGNPNSPRGPVYIPRGPDGRMLRIPRGPNGELVPPAGGPQTQIGWREGRNGSYPQTLEWGENCTPIKRVDWTDHGRRDHTFPHVSDLIPNPTGGTPRWGPSRPPKPGEFTMD